MSHRQELSTSPSCCCCCEPCEPCEPEFDPAFLLIESRHHALDSPKHALHPGAVAARLGSKQRPRAARAEAARVRRWWPWLDSNSVTLFVQQYDRGTCCELLLAINTWYRYLVSYIRGTRGLRRIRKKRIACFYMEPRIRCYTRARKFENEVINRKGQKGTIFEPKKI